ncbi:putative callose synthase 6 [Pistacia vera]|uniref:putative callose synthase 6 n=1 Tax=Pistacia vera TaxID=55513 RepID=UPI0012639DD4|nr:putative callose synthase 6 [Pistacia vera]
MNRKRKKSVRLQIEDSSLMMDSELVPSSLAEIAPILRAANCIQEENPRVAYLCRFHAFEKAHSMDPTSGRRGARQFKTKLLHRLEKVHLKEEEETIRQLARNDPREIQLYYQIFCENYINKVAHTKKLDEMAKIWQIATILYDVVKTVVPSAKIDDKVRFV